MCLCVMQLMIPLNSRLFLKNFSIIMAIKDEKSLMKKLQIDIDEIIYIQRVSYISSYAKNVSAVTLFSLKRCWIQPRLFSYGKKQAQTQFTYLLIKVIVFLLLYAVTYWAGLRQNYCTLFYLRQLLIFCGRILFVNMGALVSRIQADLG